MSKKKHFINFLFLLFTVFLAYGNSLKGEFIWDDKPLIADNPILKSPKPLDKVFSSELYEKSAANYYRPVLTISFIINFLFSGNSPFGYHLVNILLHFCVGYLFYLFLVRMEVGLFVSFASSMLFLVSPLHGQVVTYISGRADSLMAIFLMLSLIFYIDSEKKYKMIFVSCFCFVLALLSKETAFVLPVVLIALDKVLGFEKKFLFQRITPFLVIAGSYVFLRLGILNFSCGNPFLVKKGFAVLDVGFLERFILFGKTLLIYFGAYVSPVYLHMERFTAYEKIYPLYWAGVVVCVGAIWIASKKLRTASSKIKALAVFFIFWFFVWLFPQSAFIFPKIMAEHFLYLPLMAVCFFAAYLVSFGKSGKIKTIIFVLMVLYFSFFSYRNNKDWMNELQFFQKTVQLSPASIRACDSLASLYLERGRYDDAEREYQHMLSLVEKLAEGNNEKVLKASVFYNLGILHERRAQLGEALLAYSFAIEANPKMEKAYNNSGLLLQRLGDKAKAEEFFKKAIELDGKFYQAYNNLAQLYASQGYIPEAINLWNRALDIYPDYEVARKNIGLAQKVVENH